MADWTDDEWDCPSSTGLSSSSLPQSVRDVLETVTAECNAGAFGSYGGSILEKPLSMVGRRTGDGEQGCTKKVVAETNEVLGTEADLSGDEMDVDTQEATIDVISEHSSEVNEIEGVSQQGVSNPVADDSHLQENMKKSLTPTNQYINNRLNLSISAQQGDSSKMKSENKDVNAIFSFLERQKTNIRHWIKIAKEPRLGNAKPITSNLVHESETPVPLNIVGVSGRKVRHRVSQTKGMERVDVKRKARESNCPTYIRRQGKHRLAIQGKKACLVEKGDTERDASFGAPAESNQMDAYAHTAQDDIADCLEPNEIEGGGDSRESNPVEGESRFQDSGMTRLEATTKHVNYNTGSKFNSLEAKQDSQELNDIFAFLESQRKNITDQFIKIAKKPHIENTIPVSGRTRLASKSKAPAALNCHKVRGTKVYDQADQTDQTDGHTEGVKGDDLEKKQSSEGGSLAYASRQDSLRLVNVSNTVENPKHRECIPTPKCGIATQPPENFGECGSQQKLNEDNDVYIDLTGSPESPDHQRLNDKYERRVTRSSHEAQKKDRTEAVHKEKGPSPKFEPPNVEAGMNLANTGDEVQTMNETRKQVESIDSGSKHEEQGEKYCNTRLFEGMAARMKSNCQKLAVEQLGTPKARDGHQVMYTENVKVEPTCERQTNGNQMSREANEVGQSHTASLMIWRQQLLSRDFNLMYGSLRAVLMNNLSKEERHRLIQTMIATSNEIEEVIMGGGKPVDRSIRCETPELSTNLVEVKQEEMDDSEGDFDESKSPKKVEMKDDGSVSKDPLTQIGEIIQKKKMALREREYVLNVNRMKKLMKKCSDGTLKCLVCMKTGIPRDRTCQACSAFAFRVEKNYTIGTPLPTCCHANYSGAPKCKSCRFRKFCFLSMTAKHTRTRDVSAKTCPVCRNTSFYRRGWKCTGCYNFFARLCRKEKSGIRYRVPTCKHRGEYTDECDGCRILNLQEAWPLHEPNRKYPLPLVKKHRM